MDIRIFFISLLIVLLAFAWVLHDLKNARSSEVIGALK